MSEGHHKKRKEKQRLVDFPIIKPGIAEHVLCIQRQHPIVFVTAAILQGVIALFLLAALFFIAFFLSDLQPFNNGIVLVDIALVIVSIFSVSIIFTFLTWYYQFYIVTNKSIIHRYCFRIAGPFSEIVYAERMHRKSKTSSTI